MWIDKKRLKKTWLWVRIRQVRLKRWWFKYDRRFGIMWRLGTGTAAVLILASVVLPVLQQLVSSNSYKLSAATLKLVGNTDSTLAKQLSYDGATDTYQFNKDAVKSTDDNPLTKLQTQVGTASGKQKDKSLYALDVPTDFKQGVTYHDVNSQLSFSLLPQFKASPAKTVDGHLVFPLAGDSQAIYTLKNNGLKEDIVVQKVTQDSMTFSYKLQLPKTLEAKVMSDGSGRIGIYSANPALFGNISYGSDRDRASVEKARENGAKDFLVFGLPAPVIKDTAGNEVGSAQFHLNGSQLSVVASGLDGTHGPVTIDPSVVVSSTGDFQSGNVEDNIDFGTSGQITRGGATGGSVSGGWTTNSDSGSVYSAAFRIAAVAYNGYFYEVGGDSGLYSQVYYAQLNSGNGSLGAWASTTSMPLQLSYVNAAAYNGFIYAFAGYDNTGSAASNKVSYAPLNSDGTVGTWTTSANTMTNAVCRSNGAVYNGYLYAVGGTTSPAAACGDSSTSIVNTVQYAPLQANGNVGTWATTTNHPTYDAAGGGSGIMSAGVVAYNGYLYSLGGQDATHTYSGVQYAAIKSTGDLGAWQDTQTISGGATRFGVTVYNGYLYATGTGSPFTNTKYARINANGSLDSWQTSTSFNAARTTFAMTSYNGYLYITGGSSTAGGTPSVNSTEYAKIDAPGIPLAYTTSGNTFTTARTGNATVAYNDTLYIIGGDAGSTPVSALIYKATISANGSIGSFSTTSSTFTTARTMIAAFAYNNFMYIVGGCTSALSSCTTAANNSATVISAPISTSSHNPSNTWTAQTSITTARYGLSAVAYNGFAYVMGGLNGSTFQNDVQYAAISSAGAITSWTTATSTFNIPTARASFGLTISGNYLYLAGGCSAGNLVTCTTSQSDIQYAQFASAGGLVGAWASAGSGFTNARYGLGLVTINNYLYITAGYNGTTYYADTQYIKINTDGTISGSWVAGTSFANPSWGGGVASYSGAIIIAGGVNGATYYNNVYYTSVNNDGSGSSGTWTAVSSSFDITSITAYGVNGWYNGQMFANNGNLYLVGGFSNGSAFANVYYTTLGADGSLSGWTATTSLNTARYNFGLETYNGYVYVVGGEDSGGTALSSVEYAPITKTGGVGTWTTSGNAISEGLYYIGVDVYNGFIYGLGGSNNGGSTRSTVQYAALNATTGSVGTWSTSTAFTTARYLYSQTAIYDGYVYIMGGFNGSYLGDVQYAPLNSNGTVGTWKATSTLITVRRYAQAFAYNGYMYVVGGDNNGVSQASDVQLAPIHANGTLGTFVTAPGSAVYATAHKAIAATISNGVLYMVGGYTSTNTGFVDAEYTPLSTTSHVGHYSKLLDFGTAINLSGISYNGTLPYGAYNISYRTAGNDGVLGTTNSVNGATYLNCNLTGGQQRYVWISIVLDDSFGQGQGGGFPDIYNASVPAANVTDLTLTYTLLHPAANVRLRGGQTLQTGTLSPLDTCAP